QEQFVKTKAESERILKELGEKKWGDHITEFTIAITDVNTFVNKIEQLLKDYPRLHASVVIDGEFHFDHDKDYSAGMHDDLLNDYQAGETKVRKRINWYAVGYEFSSASNLTQRFYGIITKAKKYLKKFKGIKSFTIFNLWFNIRATSKKVKSVKKIFEAPKLQIKERKAMSDKFIEYKITYPFEIAPKTVEEF